VKTSYRLGRAVTSVTVHLAVILFGSFLIVTNARTLEDSFAGLQLMYSKGSYLREKAIIYPTESQYFCTV
jgi:hypothetical protein